MSEEERREGFRARGEDTVAELANALLENPLLSQALAQKRAMGAVGVSSVEEVERLERRIRSLSQRLEAVEDQLDQVGRDVGAVRRKLAEENRVSADQEKLKVSDPD